MSRKADREWATRAEAVHFLASNPNASANDIIGILFNSKPEKVAADVIVARRRIVDNLKAERAKQDAVIAAAEQAAKATEPSKVKTA